MTGGHAPKGGVASHVNGQWYAGGQFIPDHGKFCGKGRNRVAQSRFDDAAARFREHGRWTLVFDEKLGKFRLLEKGGNGFQSAANLATLEVFLG